MNKKLIIPFGEYQIVAQVDTSYEPDIPPELRVWVEAKSGNFIQDICLVRQSMSYNITTHATDIHDDAVQCLVWSDPTIDDLTHDFIMDVRQEEYE